MMLRMFTAIAIMMIVLIMMTTTHRTEGTGFGGNGTVATKKTKDGMLLQSAGLNGNG